MNADELDTLEALARKATPGPWERGDHWHIQGSDHCQCHEHYGPLIEERRMSINGQMMLAHVHRAEEPWWDHGIYSVDRHRGYPNLIVNDTDEYGYMDDSDAEYIAAANPATVLALIADLRRAQETIDAIRQADEETDDYDSFGRTVRYILSTYDEGASDDK